MTPPRDLADAQQRLDQLQGYLDQFVDALADAQQRLDRVHAIIERLDRRGCISCSSLTGGDDLAAELREAIGGEQ